MKREILKTLIVKEGGEEVLEITAEKITYSEKHLSTDYKVYAFDVYTRRMQYAFSCKDEQSAVKLAECLCETLIF